MKNAISPEAIIGMNEFGKRRGVFINRSAQPVSNLFETPDSQANQNNGSNKSNQNSQPSLNLFSTPIPDNANNFDSVTNEREVFDANLGELNDNERKNPNVLKNEPKQTSHTATATADFVFNQGGRGEEIVLQNISAIHESPTKTSCVKSCLSFFLRRSDKTPGF
jgi:hypothetical protein